MEKKLRHSHQRDMIYRYLMSTEEHPSAEMIYNQLKEEVQGLSLGTVYRNLKLLEELGKVRKVASYQGTERYDAKCGDHVHFLCRHCGSVYDVIDADAGAIRAALPLDRSYKITKLDLTVTGTCPDCADKDDAEKA